MVTREGSRGRTVSVILFGGFEVLDVFGPVELFAHVPGWSVEFVGPVAGEPVTSAQGAAVVAQTSYAELNARPGADVLLVPGGRGRLSVVQDTEFLAQLGRTAERADIVASVCTGSGILAAAGALEGRRATSNKLAWGWATSRGHSVTWVPQARWVTDGRFWTSSGVAAGMDMAHALISDVAGPEVADRVADEIELEVHRDPGCDPFAAIHGAV